MPTAGAYEFKLASKAVNLQVPNEHLEYIGSGEWAWVNHPDIGLMLIVGCPDCEHPATLWRMGKGHHIAPDGNVSPSVFHSYMVAGKEACGFHTQPTRLLGFVDLRDSCVR